MPARVREFRHKNGRLATNKSLVKDEKHVKAIIEHLEGKLSKWVLLEYEHSSSIVGRNNLTFTNVKGKADRKTLGEFGTVTDKSVSELELKNLIVLDPSAKKPLSPSDFPATTEGFEKLALRHSKPQQNPLVGFENHTIKGFSKPTIVIGGICGDNPRQGRTFALLTSVLKKPKTRNIGKPQFTIDGAAYVAKKVSEGAHLGEIKVKPKLALELNECETVEIPLAYPKGFVTPGLAEMLKRKRTF